MPMTRRFFIFSTAGLLTAPLATRFGLTGAAAAESSLLFHADMEVTTFSYYENPSNVSFWKVRGSGNAPVISTEQARSGTRSARVFLSRYGSSNSYRTEAEVFGSSPDRSMEFRKTYWIGFSIFVPPNWRVSSTDEVLFQTHMRPSDWNHGFNFSPELAIRLRGGSDRWQLRQTYVQTEEGSQQQSDRRVAFDEVLAPIATGAWTDWVFQYCPDWRNLDEGGVGVTRAWMNGEQVIDYVGPNCVNNTLGPYIKWGCYKSRWKSDAEDVVTERLYFYDEMRVSKPNEGNYDLVAPKLGTPSGHPNPPQIEEIE